MQKLLCLVIFSLCLSVLLPCQHLGASPAHSVQVVENSAAPTVETFHLDKNWHKGSDDNDEIFFGEIRKVLADANGNVIVVDYRFDRVMMFDREGNHIVDLARKGGADGEFQKPCDAFLIEANGDYPDEHVGIVSRFGKSDMTVAKVGYSYDEQWPKMPDYAVMNETESFFGIMNLKRLRAGRHIFLRDTHDGTSGNGDSQGAAGTSGARFTRYLSSTDKDKRLIDYDHYSFMIPDPGLAKEGDFDQFENYWDADDRRAYLARGDEYEVSVYDIESASPIMTIKREADACRRDNAEKEFMREAFYERFKRHAPGINIKPRDNHRAVQGITVRDNGTVWVQTLSGNCNSGANLIAAFDIYGTDGKLQRQVRFTTEDAQTGYPHFNRVILGAEGLYVVSRGEGNPTLAAYGLPPALRLSE